MATVPLLPSVAFLVMILLLGLQPGIVTADPGNDVGPLQPPFLLDNICNVAMCGKGTCMRSRNTSLGFECKCQDGWMQARPIEADFLRFLPCVIPDCSLNYTCSETGPLQEYPNSPYSNPLQPYNPNSPYNFPRGYPNSPYNNPNQPYNPNSPYNFPRGYPNSPYNSPYSNPNQPYNPNSPYNFPRGYPNSPYNNPNQPYNPDSPYNFPHGYPNSPYDPNQPFNLSFYNPCFLNNCGGGYCNVTSAFTHSCICREGFFNLFNASIFPCYRECAFGAGCSSLGINTTTSVLDPNPLLLHGDSSDAGARLSWFIAALTTFARLDVIFSNYF